MTLFEITVKRTIVANGIRLEKGMSVEIVSTYSNPISTNGGYQVIEAFDSLCNHYKISLNHHDALSDAKACAELFLIHLQSLKQIKK